jgi:hypothetical protein
VYPSGHFRLPLAGSKQNNPTVFSPAGHFIVVVGVGVDVGVRAGVAVIGAQFGVAPADVGFPVYPSGHVSILLPGLLQNNPIVFSPAGHFIVVVGVGVGVSIGVVVVCVGVMPGVGVGVGVRVRLLN